MSFEFCSLSSGSSGNCYIVKTENTALLIDAGISGKRIFEGLAALGIEDSMLKGLLITHEHIDHVKSVRMVSKKKPFVNVYASQGTLDEIADCVPIEKRRVVFAGREFTVGDIAIRPFALSHDAVEPVGYSLMAGGRRISIVTDTGIVTEEIHAEIKDSDILVLEANHDVHTLQFCKYPYHVKRRILGEYGHLSNDAAAEELCRICLESKEHTSSVADATASPQGEARAEGALQDSFLERRKPDSLSLPLEGKGDHEVVDEVCKAQNAECESSRGPRYRQVILAHLSKENNFPEMAYQTVKNVLEEHDIYIGCDLSLHIIERDKISAVYTAE